MTNTNIENFKTYEGYENMYIVEDYCRHKNIDTVLYSSTEDVDAMEFMDENELWDECTLFYIDHEGNAIYPEF